MHICSNDPAEKERVFALQMILWGLSVLLGIVVVIQYGSPGKGMNADGVHAAMPMYGVQRYPQPLSDFMRSSAHGQRSSQAAASKRSAMSSQRVARSSSNILRASSARSPKERVLRRAEGSERVRRSSSRSSARAGGSPLAPGWFWR